MLSSQDGLLTQGGGYRLAIFATLLVLIALWETLQPDRARQLPRHVRWPGAAVIMVAGAVASRLAAPAGLAGVAIWAAQHGFGVLNIITLPAPAAFAATILALDLAVYLQHRLSHGVGLLWRLHRVHHADIDVDVATALRFHPLEILLSLAWKGAFVALLGAPAAAALAFEALLNASAMFNHANARLPAWLDRRLRLILVTPAMHRRHHGEDRADSETNFGFFLSFWDRLFATWSSEPPGSRLGQGDFRSPAEQGAVNLLLQPLRAPGRRGQVSP